MHYSHLSLAEREQIFAWREAGLSLRQIAKRLGRKHSTISREYKRHTRLGKQYIPCKADEAAKKIARIQRTKAPLKNPRVFFYVREKLREGLSPELISGRLSLNYPGESIHHETIYRYIYLNSFVKTEKLWQYLTLHRKRRLKKNGRKVKSGRILNRVMIESRPAAVRGRRRFGDWETDLMEGVRSDREVISVSVERKSRYLVAGKLTDKKSLTKLWHLVETLSEFDQEALQTITADNGSENSSHELLSELLKVKYYFCNPYHSWEKGSVENAIGRLRKYIPKGMSLKQISAEKLEKLVEKYNDTPRKCLNYYTPLEVFHKYLT